MSSQGPANLCTNYSDILESVLVGSEELLELRKSFCTIIFQFSLEFSEWTLQEFSGILKKFFWKSLHKFVYVFFQKYLKEFLQGYF